jgi:hypothetical protein
MRKSSNLSYDNENSLAKENVNSAGSVCDQKTSKFFVLHGRIHGRTYGCKRSVLKVREAKHKGKHGEAQVEAGSQESVFLLFRCFYKAGTLPLDPLHQPFRCF